MEFYDFPYIRNVIIPTDELIFFRGVGIPPTRVMFGVQLSAFEIHWAMAQKYFPKIDDLIMLDHFFRLRPSFFLVSKGIQGFSRAILIEGSPTRSGRDDSSVDEFSPAFGIITHHARNQCDGRTRFDPNHEPT